MPDRGPTDGPVLIQCRTICRLIDRTRQGCHAFLQARSARFLIERGPDLTGAFGAVDGIVVVPSTKRPPPRPLAEVSASLDLDTPLLDGLRRGPGELEFRKPNPEGYEIKPGSSLPKQVLLVDDVYTTGARVNSAAYALRANGVEVAGFLVMARRVNTGYYARGRSA